MGKPGTIEVKALGGTSEPKQLEFFDKALFRITSKEHQRSLETITKELIRMGIPNRSIVSIIGMMTDYSDEIKGAAEQIDYL